MEEERGRGVNTTTDIIKINEIGVIYGKNITEYSDLGSI